MSFSHESLLSKGGRRFVATAIAFSLIAAIHISHGHAGVWTDGAGDGDYNNPLNWDDGLIPSALAMPPDATFAPNSTQDINGAFTVTRDADSSSGRTFLKGGAVMNIIGGVHNDGRSGANIFNFVGDSSAGTVNQSAGDFGIGHGLRVGVGAAPEGTFNLTGGNLNVFRGSNSKSFATNPGGRPSIEIGDAVPSPSGGSSGLLEISGGSMVTRGPLHIAPWGEFSVVGSTATQIGIGSNGSLDGLWLQAAGGLLSVEIDAGGLTPILIDDVGTGAVFDPAGTAAGLTTCTDCAVLFQSGSFLDLSGVTPTAPSTFVVMEVENRKIDDQGLGFLTPPADPLWQLVVDNSGTNGLLLLEYDGGGVIINPPGLDCDLDADGDCDQADIDVLYTMSPSATDITDWLADASDPTNPYKTSYAGGTTADTYVLGDVNLDGDVTSVDLGLLLNNFSSTTGNTWGSGDLNADGNVNSIDLGLLLNNFGSMSAGSAVSAVPEPSAGMLMLLSALGVLGLLRRR